MSVYVNFLGVSAVYIAHRRDVLKRWKQKLGSRATYRELIKVFRHNNFHEYADVVTKICGKLKSILLFYRHTRDIISLSLLGIYCTLLDNLGLVPACPNYILAAIAA